MMLNIVSWQLFSRQSPIPELILSDQHEQRRMFALLDDMDHSDVEGSQPYGIGSKCFWKCTPRPRNACSTPSWWNSASAPEARTAPRRRRWMRCETTMTFRDAISSVDTEDVGDEAWWTALAKSREANSDHMGSKSVRPTSVVTRI